MDQVLAKGTCDPVPSSGLLKNSLLQHVGVLPTFQQRLGEARSRYELLAL